MQGSLADDFFYFFIVLNPAQTDFPLFLRTKRPFSTISNLEATDQLPLSGCVSASGRYLPSAADEEWHSLKGLKAQWHSNSCQFYRGKYLFACKLYYYVDTLQLHTDPLLP